MAMGLYVHMSSLLVVHCLNVLRSRLGDITGYDITGWIVRLAGQRHTPDMDIPFIIL